jgi:hypothetical protein
MVFNLKGFGQEKDYKVYKSRKKVKRKNPDIYFAIYPHKAGQLSSLIYL